MLVADAGLYAVTAAPGELRAAGWPAPEGPGSDEDTDLDGRDHLADRLPDEVDWLRQCAGWLRQPRRGAAGRGVLGSVVQAAAGGSGIAVLVGGSSTGKTRACWEALQLLRDRKPGGGCGIRSTRPAPMPRCASCRPLGRGPWCG